MRDEAPAPALVQGSLDLLILSVLRDGPRHGFGVARAIEEASGATLRVQEGSLYPALHRMARRGFLAVRWGASESNRRARFYRLTPSGKREFADLLEAWRTYAKAVERVTRPPSQLEPVT